MIYWRLFCLETVLVEHVKFGKLFRINQNLLISDDITPSKAVEICRQEGQERCSSKSSIKGFFDEFCQHELVAFEMV